MADRGDGGLHMDWARAKTVLMVAFLALNLFLGHQILQERTGRIASGSREEVELLREALAQAELVLGCRLPKPRQMSLLQVRTLPWDEAALLQTFFPSPPEVCRGDGGRKYRLGDEELSLSGEGTLRVTLSAGLAPDDLGGHQVRALAARYLERLGGIPGGGRLDFIAACPGGWVVQYVQVYQGWPLFGGGLRMVVGTGASVELECYWFEPLGFVGRPQMVLGASQALLRALQDPQAWPPGSRVIADVSLGYYSHPYDAAHWEAVPVWQVRMGSGDLLWVNALTGMVEGVRPAPR